MICAPKKNPNSCIKSETVYEKDWVYTNEEKEEERAVKIALQIYFFMKQIYALQVKKTKYCSNDTKQKTVISRES